MTVTRYDPKTVVPTSIEDALARWDAGLPVFTVECGGLGPSYDQCIHVAVMYALRRFTMMPEPPPDDGEAAIEKAIRGFIAEADRELHLTGAQAAVGTVLAFQYVTKGWQATLDMYPKDRITQISNDWPREPGRGEADQGMRL